MLYYFALLLWITAAYRVHQFAPTWVLILFIIGSIVNFFAWALVRGGSSLNHEDSDDD